MSNNVHPVVKFAVERRVTMGMAVLGVLVLGWLSLERLPLEFLPSFSSSDISVRCSYSSSSPEEVARLIVRPLEDGLGTINGIDTLTSTASANSANVSLKFVDGTDMDLAAVEVRDRIDRIRHLLPGDLDRIDIRRFQSSDFPVLRMNLSSPWPRDELYTFVEDVVQRRLERLEGVAQVSVRGLRTRQLQVNLNPSRMAAHGIDVRELVTRLRGNNITLAAGYIREGSRKLAVRAMGELRSLEQLRELPLNGNGLRVKDVADVEYDYPRREDFNFLNGGESLSVEIHKSSTANLLAVADRIKAEMAAIQAIPEARGLDVHYFRDSSQDVRKGLSELARTGILGGALAIVFMFFFLRKVRTTLLVAIAIPVSLIVTFVIMYLARQAGFSHMTINIMSLMGLMLAIGMLVDNSIVVIESIFRHRQELKEDAHTAALRGASEVALPILASTVTTMCVFIPLIFLQSGGGFSRFMVDIGITVCIVMVASLVVSLTVVPMVAAFLLSGESRKRSRGFDRLVEVYGSTVRLSLRHRLAFCLIIAGMLYGSWRLFQTIERDDRPPSHERQILVHVDSPRNYSLERAQELYREIYDLLDRNREELEIADIAFRYSRGGGRSRGGWRGTNRFELFLVEEEQSRTSTLELQNRLRELMPVKPGVTFKIAEPRHGPGRGSSIQVELTGEDLTTLELLADEVVARLEAIPFLRDVDTSLDSGDEEIHVAVNRERALQAGLSSTAVAYTISSSLSTRAASHVKTEDREVDLTVGYREEDRQTLDQLKKMQVFAGEAPLPISTLASFALEPGPRTIEREDRRAKLTISANPDRDMPFFALMGPMSEILGSLKFPPGYEWSFGRRMWESQQDSNSAIFSLVFALLLIYMIMAALFENFVQPFTIMFAVPFAFIGVALILKLAKQDLSNTSYMGLIILAGVVVNNAIVLIDHINRLRREGLGRTEAIVLGGQHRLRPILMTAMTTVLGLAPMVAPFFLPGWFGQLEGRAAQWAPVGLVIMGGLAVSTVLTVTVIPTIYSLLDDLTRFLKRVARTA